MEMHLAFYHMGINNNRFTQDYQTRKIIIISTTVGNNNNFPTKNGKKIINITIFGSGMLILSPGIANSHAS